MPSSGSGPSHAVLNHNQPHIPSRVKRPYNAPKCTVLSSVQAEAKLKAKTVPGDPGTEKLLDSIREVNSKA
jgi:hypothetical protein